MAVKASLIFLMASAFAGCGGSQSASDQAGGGAGTGGGAADDANNSDTGQDASTAGSPEAGGTGGDGGSAGGPFFDPPDAMTYPDAVATDAWCAPDAESAFALTACCNDTPCNGQCYEGDGGLECGCFHLKAGCQDGTVCCGPLFECTTVFSCGGK